MTEWDVSVEFASIDDAPLDGSIAEDLVAALADHGGVVSVMPGRLAIDVSVSAGTHTDALAIGVGLVLDALRAIRFRHGLPIERVEAKTAARAERDLAEPTYPEMLGTSEVAELLGVSKQRVSELRESGRFPAPLADLRAGPVWPKPAVERFLQSWERKPGRPRRATA